MLYKPFKTAQDFESLIHIGETPESIHWDYKRTFNPKEPANIAIDLAAFANTYGGTLLFGVEEKKVDDLKVAIGIVSGVDAEEIKRHVYTSILDLISPKIDVQVVSIKVSDKTVVAVNVEPSINLISVRSKNDLHAFCFPYRTDFGNRYMSFEEVEKRMVDNKTRAMYLKLKKYIPERSKVRIYPTPLGNAQTEWAYEWIDKSENEFKLICNDVMSIRLPVSAVEEIWEGNAILCLKLKFQLRKGFNFIDIKDF